MAAWTTPPERAAGVWTAFRHVDRRFRPLWYGGGQGSVHQEDGRWHRGGEGVAQYLSLSSNGAWAERCRYAGIRDDVRRLEDRRDLWLLQVVERDVADLRSFDAYAACGLEAGIAVGPHEACWPLADDLRAAGYRGVLSPAAAYEHPGAVSLTLFGERLEDEHFDAMPPPEANPRPETFVSVVRLAAAASPTPEAMAGTCALGARHAGFERWRG